LAMNCRDGLTPEKNNKKSRRTDAEIFFASK